MKVEFTDEEKEEIHRQAVEFRKKKFMELKAKGKNCDEFELNAIKFWSRVFGDRMFE